MSQQNVDEASPVPDYELEQYFPRERELTDEQRRTIREKHGVLRTYFVSHPDRFRRVQRWLNQARMGVTYDVYLSRSAQYAAAAGAVGLLLGVFLTARLASAGVFAGLADLPLVPPALLGLRVPIVGTLLTATLVGLLGGGTWAARYYYPRTVVGSRERSINVLLPHAIVYMYALSHGGMNTFEVVREVAAADEVYAEVSEEFEMIVRDVELFGNDFFTAIRDARNLTPSDNLEQFLDDLLSVLDSGSDIDAFLESESETYMDEARAEQDSFLETLSILSEIFVVAFVAAPLFLIVTLLVISLLGGESLAQTYALVYVGLPLGMVAFLLVVDVLSKPFATHTATLELQTDEPEADAGPRVRTDPQFEAYERRKRRNHLLDMAKHPLETVRQRSPLLTLLVTVPVALGVVLLLGATGALDLSWQGFERVPVRTTMGVAVLPFLIVAVPLTLLYENQHRREQRITRRFPDTLNILSSANQMGIRLTESLDLVARWSEGVLSAELRKVRNDIEWNHDVERALLEFANRLRVPQVTRTMKLIAKGSRSTSDLSRVLSIAAEDTRNRYQIERKRRSEMAAYTAIVVIGFLVYLAVIVLVDTTYLDRIGQMSPSATTRNQGPLVSVADVPVDAYRTVFFHSALIQGVGSGLLAGKLAENDTLAGLKYSIVLVAIALAVFFVV